MKIDFANKRVTLMGLGLFGGGVGAARFLIRQGASLTITDLRSDQVLAESVEALKGLPIAFRLGEHREADFREADVVVVSPAVPRESPFLQMAREAGTTVVARDNLIFQWCPAPILGVTGSNGKTTTVSLIGAMFRRVHPGTIVGGNIGGSVLDQIEEIHADTPVILELSSFQLEDLQEIGMSPHVAVVTNLSPNHLDRHGTFEEYVRAKKGIIHHQRADDVAILNYDDPAVRLWAGECPGKVIFFSVREPLSDGAFVQEGRIVVRIDPASFAPRRPQRTQRRPPRKEPTSESSAHSARSAVRTPNGVAEDICGTEELILPGRHNVENALAAAAAAWIGGVGKGPIAEVLRSFEGVAHRLEFVRKIQGVRYYNDSIATTPESVIAALDAFEGGIVMIAGGSDKGISFDRLADEIVRKAKAVVLIGTTASKIAERLEARRGSKDLPSVMRCDSLEEAVRHAQRGAQNGDVVLLSPACASYDMFRNFEDRGNRFKALVERL